MLVKLLKYEFKATARWFLPLYGGLVVIALINRLFWGIVVAEHSFDEAGFIMIPAILSTTVFFFLLMALGVITLLVMVQRFYKNLLRDEGYLMFTLPVSAAQNMNCKLIVSMVWSVASSVIITGICVGFAYSLLPPMQIAEIYDNILPPIQELLYQSNFTGAQVVFALILSGIVSTASGILQVYVSIAIGSLANRYKLAAAFGIFVGINFIKGLISNILMFTFQFSSASSPFEDFYTGRYYSISYWIALAVPLVLGVVYYWVANWILSKRLNLE